MSALMTHPINPREKVLLKPCPFCGGEAVAGSDFDNDHYVMCGADCDKCGGMVGYMKTEVAAIENWNRRTALASGSGDHAELARLKAAMSKSNDEICQSLGKALGYPWFKDDQRNFPGATEENGVCVGDHVAESIADEAASRISALLAENAALRASVVKANDGFEEYERRFYLEQERATEAERKLAEAVGLLREWMGTWFVDADSRGENAIADDTRKFLSKEAERG